MNNPHEQYDYCIIGTGAAGGILAHRLAQAGLNVISLEQGEQLPNNYFSEMNPPGAQKDFGIRDNSIFPPNPDDALFTHALFAKKNTRSSDKISEEKFRHFQLLALNGLQNLWNGVSVRFSPTDFEAWPISYSDLAPHYTAVEKRIIVCGTQENIPNLPDGDFIPPKPLRPADILITKAIQSLHLPDTHVIPNRKAIETRPGKTNTCISMGLCTSGCPVGAVYKFSNRLLPEIINLDNYTLRLNTKATKLITDNDSSRIIAVEYLDTQTQQTHTIHANHFIVSTGAIESPRLLLNSQNDHFPHGLANSTNTLGCYLQDNPKAVLSTSLYKLIGKKAAKDIGYGDLLLITSKATLKNEEPFTFIGHAIHNTPDIPYYLSEFKHIPKLIKPVIAKLLLNSYVVLGLFCKGDFNKNNRVERSLEKDQYDIPQIRIHYQSTSKTIERMEKMQQFGYKVLRKASGTKITSNLDNTGTGIHYAGTCRMGKSKSEGIVDANLQSFDHENLYICDGSVIPMLPDKHLTLTIMALADRLAEHLISR